ncbi:MAG TPA: FG-GAP-like repeat-containing protein [Bryobacteraceae bacterium]|nr:FG-GAP-like repeat-containing protein [Bryobacteraceae bacterium]
MSDSRRKFLARGLALPFAAKLHAQTTPLLDAQLHVHPHYRAHTALDAEILKAKAGLDDFITEKYHDQIAVILGQWRAGFPGSVATALATDFLGASPQPVESSIVRPGPALEVRRVTFTQQPALARDAFVRELRTSFGAFSTIHTAEFQVTQIERQPDGALRTRVRYELVGSGSGYHREQRIGFWDLEWEAAQPDQYRVRRWLAGQETRSRSAKPWYEDIAPPAFQHADSYREQMVRGVDDWRTVLDAACGIDVYGHNGVSAGDIDGDGFDDLYVCQPAGLPNRLYRNRGDGTFEDITATSGVGLLENTACAIFADFDNDGRQDLIVVRAAGPQLFLNQGNGKFHLEPDAFHFVHPPQGTFTGAAAADYDRDGWLDIYFCLYSFYQGADQYRYPSPYYAAENGPPNFMMRNNRDGTFRDVTAVTGLNQNNTRYSFCCGWGDYNRDGWPDLYVVNDFGRKNLYRNNGDGTFTDVAAEAGVEDVGAGMSACWFDHDNDGFDDLYVGNMWTAAGERVSTQAIFQRDAPPEIRALYRKHAMGNSLFRNRGGGRFEDVTLASGAGMGRWAWSSDAYDFDHDGFADLYIANGMLSGPMREDLNSFFWRQVVANSSARAKPSEDYEQGWNAINEMIRADYTWSGYERNVFYANNRDGTFSDVSGVIDLDFLEDSRSFALADFDHDGRQEVFLKNRSAPQLRLLKNVIEDLPPSISFRLRGVKSNPDAIGAAVSVETDAGRQTKMLQAGSGFLSQHSKDMFFGLGQTAGLVKATIRWPSGLVQQLPGLPMNHRIWVEEGVEPSRMEPFKATLAEGPSRLEARSIPKRTETWLLVPLPAPDRSLARGKPMLLQLFDEEHKTIAVTPDLAAVYNILYRYLFDRHRDLTLPVSFLIDAQGNIVKVYQGPIDPREAEKDFSRIPQSREERLALALPFAGNTATYEFSRNNLSLGSAFFQRGYYDEAEASFRTALRNDPSSAEAQYGLGSVYLKQDKNAQARAAFEQTLKLTASYPDTAPNAWNNLGLLATREGRTGDAVNYFQEALRANPDYWIALENLGNAYRQQRRWDEARSALERAAAARPKDAEANYSLAMAYAQMDDTDHAYQYLQKALALRPAYPEALNNLGVLYLRTRRRDDAVAKFAECIRVAPEFDRAYLNLARVYSIEGNRDKARAVLTELLKRFPGHPQAQQMLDQLR